MPRKRGALNLSPEMLAMRRQYNREYMRRWRADIRNYERERDNRERAYVDRKRHKSYEGFPPPMNAQRESVCGICRRLPAKCSVTRLRASASTPSGFEEVRLPYCGQC
jgi:hypothetical protein